MKKAIRVFLTQGTLFSTYGLILSVLIQVFARFLLPKAPAWTEEASRLFFIYAVAFAAGLALESREYVYLDWLFNKMSPKTQKYLKVFMLLTVLLICLLMTFYSIPLILLGHQETAPGLKIRMSYVFFSMFLMAGSLSYFAWLELRAELKQCKA